MKVCAVWPGEEFGRADIALEEACMPLDVRKLAPLTLAALLIFTTCSFAADQPPTAEGLRAAERFSADQRGHWAYQPVKRARTQRQSRTRAGLATRSIGSSSPSSKTSVWTIRRRQAGSH